MKLKILILVCVALISTQTIALAQDLTPLPIDPNVRYGKLSNGLTYYIRHNEHPKNRADFYIAQNVGSILEEDSQRGLAHFLEHMAFNGTTHYPGKAMLNYLEKIGVKFGSNVNAYTSIDETVYNISNVPVRPGTIDSCLLILYDWASEISLEEQEIDNERGVISEEWRSRQNATMRMYDSILPQLYTDSKYAHRMPIGLIDVIQNFSYQELRDYYKKWYRPDLQGIIIVGDIDAEQVENKVKELFGKISVPINAAERKYFPVPDNDKPIVVVAKDKEATDTQINIYFKHEVDSPEIKASIQGLSNIYIRSMISIMLNGRFQEIIQKPNAPFLSAGVYDDIFFLSKTKGAFTGYIRCKENEIDSALTAFLNELERVDRFGFTESEYQRAAADYKRWLTNQYNERDKQQTQTYVSEYVQHFTDGGSIAGIELEYKLMQQIIEKTTLEEINTFIRKLITHDNVAITVTGPDKENLLYPTQTEILAILEKSTKDDLQPYVDNVNNQPLISDSLKPGKIVRESRDSKFDASIWKLSNGATVIVKPTNFKNDQIILAGVSEGGSSQIVTPKDILDTKAINIAPVGGWGEFSPTELNKVLAGKNVSVSTFIGETSEQINGSASPKDVKTLLQLVYLAMTSPRKDTDAFEAWKERTKTSLINQDSNPASAFSDTLVAALYKNNPKRTPLKLEDIDKIDYDNILKLYKDRFADASQFVFTFVGNINLDTLKPLVEEYIGSLPALHRKEKGNVTDMRQGLYTNNFKRPMETPKSTVSVTYWGKQKYSYENALKLQILGSIMRIVYTKTIREEQGGTYGVSVSEGLSRFSNTFSFRFSFDTNADQEELLKKLAREELMNVIEAGPDQEDFDKVIGNMLKTYDEYQKQNNYWGSIINAYYIDGIDATSYKKIVSKQTPESIRKYARRLFKHVNDIEVTMTGIPQ